jgi:hypothetical protein
MLLCLCENVCIQKQACYYMHIYKWGEKKGEEGGHHTQNSLILILISVNITEMKFIVS